MTTRTPVADRIRVVIAKNYMKSAADRENGKAIVLAAAVEQVHKLQPRFHSGTITIEIQYVCLHYFYLIVNP